MTTYLRLVGGEPETPPTEHLLATIAIDEALGEVARCVSLVASAEKPSIEASLLGSNLLQLLALLERNAAIEDAADALHDAAQRLAWGAERKTVSNSDRMDSVGPAYRLLRSRVLTARPRS